MFEELLSVIDAGIRSFEDDPADNDFQSGYHEALLELKRVAGAIVLGAPPSRRRLRLRLVSDNSDNMP